jgi:hypothetical protein
MPAGRKVPVGSGELLIHGLPMEPVAHLWEKYAADLKPFFSGPVPDFAGIIQKLPEVYAECVCLAADLPGEEALALKLPLATQVELLLAVWLETVPNLQALVETISTVAQQTSVAMAATRPGPNPSPSPLPELSNGLPTTDIP